MTIASSWESHLLSAGIVSNRLLLAICKLVLAKVKYVGVQYVCTCFGSDIVYTFINNNNNFIYTLDSEVKLCLIAFTGRNAVQ